MQKLYQAELVGPKQFQELKTEQQKLQQKFLKKSIEAANDILLNIAAGKPLGAYLNYQQKSIIEYTKWLRSGDSEHHATIDEDSIILMVGEIRCVDADSVYAELRQLFIDAGWGEKTSVHRRACHDEFWVILEPVEEFE